MERNNIQKTICQLFSGEYKYIIPLYQRNFAWGETEIIQLLQDLYENFSLNIPYYVGTIVYIRRGDTNILEVIDGQQRLTVLTLLLNVLGKYLPNTFAFTSILKNGPLLEYDSRNEVTQYLQELYNITNNDNKEAKDNSEVITTFDTAYKTLLQGALNPKDEEGKLNIETLQDINKEKFCHFANYIVNHVYFVLAEMPQDTDVATYFEIMNNTGEQLHKHEILKSLIMGSANDKFSSSQMESFAIAWDACAQMDIRIQKAIPASKRKEIFGENFDTFKPEKILYIVEDTQTQEEPESNTIAAIVNNIKYKTNQKKENEEDDNQENKGASIIDFPNFLMHVLRLCYNDKYVKKTNADIPLNEKYLLTVYNTIKEDIDAEQFISKLLYYRIILDRYMVRTDISGENEKWCLEKPKTKREDSNDIRFVNTFEGPESDEEEYNDGQNNIIKALTMLQVSYPQRKYKRFLNEILSLFEYKCVEYDLNQYISKLNEIIFRTFSKIQKEYNTDVNKKNEGKKYLYSLGTSTPRFVLNLIDYLMYLDGKGDKFDFKYYNSVEHHLPQSYQEYSTEVLDSIGNLFLLSRHKNSSLNDRDPLTKVEKTGELNDFPPNRKMIYEQTRNNRQWNGEDINNHTKNIIELFNRIKELLKIAPHQ